MTDISDSREEFGILHKVAHYSINSIVLFESEWVSFKCILQTLEQPLKNFLKNSVIVVMRGE